MSEPAAEAGAGGGREGGRRHPADRRRDESEEAPRGGAARPASCELCGGPVLERHCRIVCLNCGFQRDCSDP